jgi:DNA repair exonuclease SbcCD nuclease subunit
MRFLHIADLHFMNCHPYSRVDPNKNINIRFLFQMKLFRMICGYAVKNNIKLILISGDVFEYYNPSSRERTEVFNLFSEFRDKGLTFFIIDGNHDTNGFWSALGYLGNFKIPDITVVSGKPAYFEEYGLACYPYLPGQTAEKINDAFKDVPKKDILMMHGPILGSAMGNGFSLKDGFKLEDIFDLGYKYTAMGDIHTAQSWEDSGRYVVYPGNVMTKDFSEFNAQQKYFMDVTIDGDKVTPKKIRLPMVNPLFVYDFDKNKVTTPNGSMSSFDAVSYTDSIVKIQVTKGNPRFEQRTVINAIYEKGASFVFAELKPSDAKDEEMSEGTSIDSFAIEDVIKEYCDKKGYDSELSLRVYEEIKNTSSREKSRDIGLF